MRLRYLSAVAVVTACGGHLKREVVGVGVGSVQVRGDAGLVATAPAGGIALVPGNYELKLRFDVPRAQIVEWTLTCPGVERHGELGETFEAYRERRLAQLRAQRERERKNTAAVTGALIGAVAPNVQAQGHASGPNGEASVNANVSGQAVGAAAGTAIADATVDPVVVELAPGDVGASRLQSMIHVAIAEPGACAVTAVADDANVLAGFDIVHVRDLRAEARARSIAANESARQVRGQLSAQLVAYGADVTLRQRRAEEAARLRAERQAKIDAEVRIRAEADARARAERQAKIDAELRIHAEAEARARAETKAKLDAELRIRADAEAQARAKAELEARAKLEIEVRLRNEALRTRGELYAYLVGTCNADPNHRQRLREEREAKLRIELEQREARLRIERDQQLELEAQRQAQLRVKEQQRLAIEAQRQEQLRIKEQRRLAIEAQRQEQLRIREQQRLAIEAERARRIDVALAVRGELRAYLVALGARERPPMPAPLHEEPGLAPFSGAVWVAGTWRWTGGQWIWEAGGWRDDTVFGAAGRIGGAISVGIESAPTPVEPPIDVRDHGVPTTTTVRDHRSEPVRTQGPTVRDHRSEPAVRDHRSGSTKNETKTSTPTVRDHRKGDDDEDKKKDGGPKVRDHRR